MSANLRRHDLVGRTIRTIWQSPIEYGDTPVGWPGFEYCYVFVELDNGVTFELIDSPDTEVAYLPIAETRPDLQQMGYWLGESLDDFATGRRIREILVPPFPWISIAVLLEENLFLAMKWSLVQIAPWMGRLPAHSENFLTLWDRRSFVASAQLDR